MRVISEKKVYCTMKLNEFSKNGVTSQYAFKKIGSKIFGKEPSLFRTASFAGMTNWGNASAYIMSNCGYICQCK